VKVSKLSNKMYHEGSVWRDAIGSSRLRPGYDMGPYPVIHPAPVELPRDAIALGTLVHLLVLEPERMTDGSVVQLPDWDFLKEGKAQWLKWCEANEIAVIGKTKGDILNGIDEWAGDNGIELVRGDMLDKAQDMARSVMDHPIADTIRQATEIETSYMHTEGSFRFKARPDILGDDYLIDLKTTSSLNWAKQAYHLRYPEALAHYEWVVLMDDHHWKPRKLGWITVGTEPMAINDAGRPIYPVRYWEMSPQLRDAAIERHQRLIRQLIEFDGTFDYLPDEVLD
jgi:hypothetical protein